jgi:multidrug efflux pump subunit AcrA (membrane-fusion protein)
MRASYVLIAGLFLGMAGAAMALRRQGKVAGGLMLVAPLTAAVMVPGTIVASGLLVLAGALALSIKPAEHLGS